MRKLLMTEIGQVSGGRNSGAILDLEFNSGQRPGRQIGGLTAVGDGTLASTAAAGKGSDNKTKSTLKIPTTAKYKMKGPDKLKVKNQR